MQHDRVAKSHDTHGQVGHTDEVVSVVPMSVGR